MVGQENRIEQQSMSLLYNSFTAYVYTACIVVS